MTDEELNYRIKVVYVTCFTYLTITFPLVPATAQALVPFPVASIERSVTRGSCTAQEKLLLDLRGDGNDVSELIIRIILIWTMSKNYKPTDGFQPKPIIPPHFRYVQPNPRMAPKLQENPVDRNNLGQGGGSCRANQHTSMDAMSNSINPEFSQYQKDYYPKSSPQRFDTSQSPSSKFNRLAYDSVRNKYTRISIDEARAVVQAELQDLVIEPIRANQLEARRVDLDFKVQGPHP